MRMVFGLVLVLGLALAGAAVYMAQNYLASMQVERDQLLAAQQAYPALIEVVVAKKDLAYGTRFTRDDLEIVRWEAGKVPAGAFNAIVAPDGTATAEGTQAAIAAVFAEGETRPRATLRSFSAFEPILDSKVTQPGVDAGISANLSPGMGALTIAVDVSSGVSGFLRPGDHVDIYWSGNANGRDVTRLLRSGVRLIAIDQSADADRTDETQVARTVTVEAIPEDVAALALAQQSGRLTLVLVSAADVGKTAAFEIDRQELLGIEEAAPKAEAPKEKVCSIKTNKGGEIVEVKIPCSD